MYYVVIMTANEVYWVTGRAGIEVKRVGLQYFILVGGYRVVDQAKNKGEGGHGMTGRASLTDVSAAHSGKSSAKPIIFPTGETVFNHGDEIIQDICHTFFSCSADQLYNILV